MKDYIENRVIDIADYLIRTGKTLREAAKRFCVSKSTAHKDMQQRLFYIDRLRFDKVKHVLDFNFTEKHLRGGAATKRKYEAATTSQN